MKWNFSKLPRGYSERCHESFLLLCHRLPSVKLNASLLLPVASVSKSWALLGQGFGLWKAETSTVPGVRLCKESCSPRVPRCKQAGAGGRNRMSYDKEEGRRDSHKQQEEQPRCSTCCGRKVKEHEGAKGRCETLGNDAQCSRTLSSQEYKPRKQLNGSFKWLFLKFYEIKYEIFQLGNIRLTLETLLCRGRANSK